MGFQLIVIGGFLLTVTVAFKVAKTEDALQAPTVGLLEMSSDSIAGLAFTKGMIPPKLHQGLMNSSLLLEGAHSAGLPWEKSDADRHVQKVIAELRTVLLQGGSEPAKLSTTTVLQQAARSLDFPVSVEFQTVATQVYAWQGSKSFSDVVQEANAYFGAILPALPVFGPQTAFAATIFFTVLGGLLDAGPSKEQQLYDMIMKQVDEKLAMETAKAQVAERISDFEALLEELDWVPGMLEQGQVQTGTWLMYGLMIQHDVGKISSKIRGGRFGKSETEAATWEWSRVMVPLLEQVMVLQTALILDVASHSQVDHRESAHKRLDNLFFQGDKCFSRWFPEHVQNVKDGQLAKLNQDLGWRIETGPAGKAGDPCWNMQKSCWSEGQNACSDQACTRYTDQKSEYNKHIVAKSLSSAEKIRRCSNHFRPKGWCLPENVDAYFLKHIVPVHNARAARRDAFWGSAKGRAPNIIAAPKPPLECNFEKDTCEWTTSGWHKWRRLSGGTPSTRTGPSSAHGGSYYIYVEASHGGTPWKSFFLTSAEFTITTDRTLKFYYYMYGDELGKLHVASLQNGGWPVLATISGNQGPQWKEYTVTIPKASTQVRFQGVTGGGWRSDIAIDDISVA